MKTKKLISVLCLFIASVICAGSLSGCSSEDNNQYKSTVFENKFGVYYFTDIGVVKLNEDNSLTPVEYKYKSDNGEEKTDKINSTLYSYWDNSIHDYYTNKKYTFKDNTTQVEEEKWIDESILNNSETFNGKEFHNNMRYFTPYEDYVYFLNIPSSDYYQSDKSVAYKLGKIKKDGSSIELFDNITASAFTVSGGWIYYFDNGFSCKSDNSEDIDRKRIGLYKMKLDGSNKTILLSDFNTNGIWEDKRTDYCQSIEVNNGYVYFIDHSGRGKSKISRINTDGTGYEQISKNGAYRYAFSGNEIYYTFAESGDSNSYSRTLYHISLNENKETEICDFKGRFANAFFSVYNDYIYLYPGNGFNGSTAGGRYNIITSTFQRFHFEYKSYTTLDGEIGNEKHISLPPECYWETVQPEEYDGKLAFGS